MRILAFRGLRPYGKAGCRSNPDYFWYMDTLKAVAFPPESEQRMDLQDFRRELDEIDTELLRLFCRRMAIVEEANAELCTATAMADWDRVLTVATPEACEKDRSMMPFAFLALGEKGQLGNRLFNYPVQSQRDFDMSGIEDSYPTLFFKGCLYQALSCPNESMHNFFQLATLQEHGQSFLVIRHLIADCFLNGDYDLVKKYCSVLSRSTLHSQYVKYFLGLTEKGTPHAPDSVTFRKTVPLISQDPLYNLFLFEGTGMHSVSSMDRLLCTLLIQRQPERFRDLFMSVKHMYPIIPRYYEEALVIAGGADNLISTSTSRRYSDLQWDPDTYWFYYMSGN